MKIFSGNSNPELTSKICKYLGIPAGRIHLHQFPSGEQYCQFKENIRGKDVYLVQSLSNPVNDHLMQLLIMADAARRASADRITAVIPYFGYARQDRKDKSRVPISAKLIMNLLASSGFDRIVTMDLHSPQVGGFTDLPFDHLQFKPALIDAIKSENIDVIVSPDIGAVKRAEEYATLLKKDMAIISKKRDNERDVEVKHFIGDVKGRRCLIVDDLTESAGTLIEAAQACKDHGASDIFVAVSHGCFNGPIAFPRLIKAFSDGIITKFLVSNTVSFSVPTGIKIETVDVSPVFAKAILNINKNESVSELFSV